MFLPGALAVSAKAHDWSTFDEWLAQYNGLPEPLRRDHSQCAIINLEGLRALDETRSSDAVKQMSRLLDAAPATQFLSNDDISALPKRLRAEGLALDLCDKFDELVKKKDWRLLKK